MLLLLASIAEAFQNADALQGCISDANVYRSDTSQ
jgi:hypothetical protein